MYFLEVRTEEGIERWPISSPSVSVGRSHENDLVIHHDSLSRAHMVLTIDGDTVRLQDRESTNGVYVDGKRVQDVRLGLDEWFVAGGVMMSVRRGIALSSREITPSRAGSGDEPHSRAERTTLGRPPAGAEAGVLDPYDDVAGAVSELSTRLAQARGTDQVLQCLVDHVASRCPVEVACLLERAGEDWSVRASSGGTLPPEVEATLLGDRDGLSADAGRVPGKGLLALEVPCRRASVYLLAYPWDQDDPVPADLSLVGSLAARLVEASRSERVDPAPAARSVGASVAAPAGASPGLEECPDFMAVSSRSRVLLEEVDALALSSLPILVQGETGTGKDLLARRLHVLSGRSAGPFVPLNCAALPSELLEAELFGIERGVATGVDERPGRFRLASGGTLFLDEVGDLPPGLQPKLLRALETGVIHPLGAAKPVPVDVRVVSATHQDLPGMIDAGRFRRDLYHRLAGAVVCIAPLRERRDEILPLARHFLRELSGQQGKPCLGIDMQVARLLVSYDWPGNVRELRHVLSRALALLKTSILNAELFPQEMREGASDAGADVYLGLNQDFRSARLAFEKLYFSQLLERCGDNLSEASRRAGLTRSHLYNKLDELDLR